MARSPRWRVGRDALGGEWVLDVREPELRGVGLVDAEGDGPPGGERADGEMLLVLTRIGSASASPPIISLCRQADGGLFDRLADHFDDRWLEATPLTSREQLHAYLADINLETRPEPEHSLAADPQPVRAPARPPEASTASPAETPRRWPRRPT